MAVAPTTTGTDARLDEIYSEGGAAVLKASAAVPMSTPRIQAAQKTTGIRFTTRTVVAATRLNWVALMVPLDSGAAERPSDAPPPRETTLTPLWPSVKGLCGASCAVAARDA